MSALQSFRESYGLLGGAMPLRSPRAGRPALCALFAAMGFSRGAEIGVWEGGFSERLCQAIPGLQLTCVDPWKPSDAYRERKNDPDRLAAAYEIARRRLQRYTCTFLPMTSADAAAVVPDRSLDFVYIDGNHAYEFVSDDLRLWSAKVRSGGILSGHDYRDEPRKPFIDVVRAVNDYTAAHHITPWFVLAGEKSPSWFWQVT